MTTHVSRCSTEASPRDPVLIDDHTDRLLLPQDKRAFVHFSFTNFTGVDCPMLTRVVIAETRESIDRFHRQHVDDIPAPIRALATTGAGFGQVVVISTDGAIKQELRDHLIFADTEPVVTTRSPDMATRVVIGRDEGTLTDEDRMKFQEALTNCSSKLAAHHAETLSQLRTARAASQERAQ